MMSSGRLPNIAFSSPPIVSPVCCDRCSVLVPISLAIGMMARAATRNLTGAPTPSMCSTRNATGTKSSIQCRSHHIGCAGPSLVLRASGVASEVASERKIEVHPLHAPLALHAQQRHAGRVIRELLLLDGPQVARADAVARLRDAQGSLGIGDG